MATFTHSNHRIQESFAKQSGNKLSQTEMLTFASITCLLLSCFDYVVSDWQALQNPWQARIEVVLVLLSFVLALAKSLVSKSGIRIPSSMLPFFVFGMFALISAINSYNIVIGTTKALLFLISLMTIILWFQGFSFVRCIAIVSRSVFLVIVTAILLALVSPSTLSLTFESEELWRSQRIGLFASHPGKTAELATMAVFFSFASTPPSLNWKIIGYFFLAVSTLARAKITMMTLSIIYILKPKYLISALFTLALVSFIPADYVAQIATTLSDGRLDSGALLWNEFSNRMSGHLLDGSGRFEIWKLAISELPETLFLGYGFSGERAVITRFGTWASDAHNGFLSLQFTSGTFGFISYLLGWSLVIRDNLRIHEKSMRKLLITIHLYLFVNFMLGSIDYLFLGQITLLCLSFAQSNNIGYRINTG